MNRLIFTFTLLASLSACSAEETPVARTPEEAPAVTSRLRSTDPRVVAAREAIDRGQLELARGLVRQVESSAGIEGPLLAARVAALAGKDSEAGRKIEEARLMDPTDARVYSTAAELHAAGGRMETAEREIQRGLEACGVTPEIERARGIFMIVTPGGAQQGLQLLESAIKSDPELPFVARALGQAHLVVAKLYDKAGEPVLSLKHIERSLEFDPEELDARRFHADALAGIGDLGAAVAIYEQLMQEGEPLSADLANLYWRIGVAALAQKKRDQSIAAFLRARSLGMNDDDLSTGGLVLESEADTKVLLARQAFEEGDLEFAEALVKEARELWPRSAAARGEHASYEVFRGQESGDLETSISHYRKAVEIDPNSYEGHYFLGTALRISKDFEGAARELAWVVDSARIDEMVLPDPVHLALAQVQFEGGETDASVLTLETYLTQQPFGMYVDQTRELLDVIKLD